MTADISCELTAIKFDELEELVGGEHVHRLMINMVI